MAADALVLKHKVINIHNIDSTLIIQHQFHEECLLAVWIHVKIYDSFEENTDPIIKGLTHCSLVMAYGIVELDQHWFR